MAASFANQQPIAGGLVESNLRAIASPSAFAGFGGTSRDLGLLQAHRPRPLEIAASSVRSEIFVETRRNKIPSPVRGGIFRLSPDDAATDGAK